MWIDTHCHLDSDKFSADRDAVIEKAQSKGVRGFVVPSVERVSFSAVRATAMGIPGCTYTLGIHPMYTSRAQDVDIKFLREKVKIAIDDDPFFVGIGEIGLDFFVKGFDLERQMRFYTSQLKIACDFDLPVILHVRRAQDLILKQLRVYHPRGGIVHAFNGSHQQAESFIKLNFKLGIGGAMTFERALQIRRLAKNISLSALVLETDAPDIPPASMRKEARNSPIYLPYIAAELASLRQLSLEQLSEATCGNAFAALPRLASVIA
ncbi:TatD family hydrolase [Candidatus Pandoraea novymonadis]|uniref:Metal-dependent hydrolase YjjV n=1 Tax=Candidatus Pandoraea novymonadis TaxID=1808959 RepID=A0ABX5FFG5_9BURK|nr:TatD family hydrolase [Candidatus Pandoraea novymonadis]PSB92218.1 putative metal-dependent hydrolase YjjV [Candidatus Pandoraea novymonadis]